MSISRRFLVGVTVVSLVASLIAVLFPAPNLLLKLLAGTFVGIIGGFVVSKLLTGRINHFLNQFKSVSRSAIEGKTDQRMGLYPESNLGEAARQFNELVDTFDERRRVLKEERNKFESILNELSDGVVAVDADEHVLYLNEQARTLLEISSSDRNEPLLSEISRDDTLQVAITTCLDTGESVHREGKRVAPDREINLTIDASPLTGSDGAVSGAVAAIHDVTELRRLQTVRQDFVANVSHELKTPLTAIQGFVETLADDEQIDPETRNRFIQKIRNQVLRMSDLVEDLLTISKLESDEGVLEAKRMDISTPLKEAVETVRPAVEKKEVQLDVDLPEETHYVEGDPAALRQIVTNLLDNAVKYTPGGGTVSLLAEKTDGDIVISVKDTGIGIEPRKQDRIFERFYRMDSGRARSEGGTGLGLAIVKHLVLTMDGEIEVESTPGQGSVFHVRLPGC